MTAKLEKVAMIGILKEARGFIEKGWCQGSFAYDDEGAPCMATSSRACAWCLTGALTAAARQIVGENARSFDDSATVYYNKWKTESYLRTLLPADKGSNRVAIWNDEKHRTQEQVLELIDIAILRLKREVDLDR